MPASPWLSLSLLLLLASSSPLIAGRLPGLPDEDGYELFPELPTSRYKLYTHSVPWTEALLYCQRDGAGALLAVLNSEQEARLVGEIFQRIPGNDTQYLSVGINDIFQEGLWMTVLAGLDRPLAESGYAPWAASQPGGGGSENCGAVDRRGELHDVPCGAFGSPFLCEKPAA